MKIKVIKETLDNPKKSEVVNTIEADKAFIDVTRFNSEEADGWISYKDKNGNYVSKVYTSINNINYRFQIEN